MSSLSSFLQERLRTEHAAHISSEETAPWWETGRSVEVDEATYYQYLDLLPPRFMSGHLFAFGEGAGNFVLFWSCLLYTSPSPRDLSTSRMPSSA